MKQVQLTVGEIALLVDALTWRASRHRSIAKARPSCAGPHDKAAAAMIALRDRIAVKEAHHVK